VRSDHDLRDAVLRLGHVKLRAVLIVEILYVLIGDGDLGHYFVIDDFLDGELLADVVPQIVHRVGARLELALKLLLGVGALEFGEFVLDFAVGGLQAERLGLLEQDVIVDQLIEDVQRERFVLRGRGRVGIQLCVVILVDFRVRDRRAVHRRPDVVVRRRRFLAAGRDRQGRGQYKPSMPTHAHAFSLSSGADSPRRRPALQKYRDAERRRLGCLRDAAGSNAGSADTNVLARSIDQCVDSLKIRIPAAAARIVGVADHVAERRTLAANCASLSHDCSSPIVSKLK